MNWRGRIDAPKQSRQPVPQPNTFLMGGQLETIFNPLQPQCLLWHVGRARGASRVLLGGVRDTSEQPSGFTSLHDVHRIAT